MRVKRLLPLISVVMLLSLLLGAIPASASPAAAPAAAATPIVTYGLSQEPPTLGYGIGNAYVNTVVKFALGSEPTLTRQNDLTDWFPYIATDVALLENGLATFVGEGADQQFQMTWKLREDVRWSDGTLLTAHDFKFAWELVMNPDHPVPGRQLAQKVSSFDVIGDHSLVVSFMSQTEARDAAVNGRMGLPARGFADFAEQEGPVIDPNYYKGGQTYLSAYPRHVVQPIIAQVGVAGLAQHAINRAPLGIGPFKLREWVPGQHIITEAVPTYFLGPPRANSVIFRIVSDTNTMLAQLATGEVDIVDSDALTEFNAPDLDELERQRRIRAFYTPSATWEHIDLNLDNAHLSDVRVRKAIFHAINRSQVVDRVLFGKTTVIHSYAPAWRWDYNPAIPQHEFSRDKTRQLLREAGYSPGPDGIMVHPQKGKLSLKYQTTAGNKMRELTTQVVQQHLKDAGIDARLDYVVAGEFFASGDNPGPLWGRTFEMGQYAWVGGDDPGGTKNIYHSNSIPARENSYVGQNFPGIKAPRLDELLHSSENILDQSQRVVLYAEAQNIWADLAAVIPIFARANTTAIKRSLQGFRPTPTGTPPSWNAHEWWRAD